MTHEERGNKWLLSIAGQLIVLWTYPLSLFSLGHGKITLTLVLIGLLLLSSYIYWYVAISCYDEGSSNFPGPVSCHHTLLFIWRNTYSGNWSLPLTSSSSHKSGLGCCCFCWVLCCSSSHILLHLQQGNKMFKQAKLFFSPAECNQQLPTMRGCWSKLQYSASLHSPVMWLEQLRVTWGLGKSHSSDCKQICPW